MPFRVQKNASSLSRTGVVLQNESAPIVIPSEARNLGFCRCRQEPRSLALLGMTLLMGFLFLSFLSRLRMRGRRGLCRWRWWPRSRSLALLLPVIEFRLLVLLVLGILLHRRSGF